MALEYLVRQAKFLFLAFEQSLQGFMSIGNHLLNCEAYQKVYFYKLLSSHTESKFSLLRPNFNHTPFQLVNFNRLFDLYKPQKLLLQ